VKKGTIITIVGVGVAIAIFGTVYSILSDFESVNLDVTRTDGTINTGMASPLLGSPSAPITIIEFGDYQCPKCKEWFLNTKPAIIENLIDTGKANLVFVDIAFLGKDSLPAAEATYCAEEQGKYWEYHGFLYSNQMGIDTGWANSDSLNGYAYNLGLDMDLFASCLDSGKYEKRVSFNTNEAVKNAVSATPTFIIVGPNEQEQEIVGPQPYEIFEKAIESML